MKKILFIASITPFLDGFEKNNILLCKNLGYEVYTASNDIDTVTKVKYESPNLDKLNIHRFNVAIQRNPFSLKNIKAFKELKKIIIQEDINIIDCHTPIGGVLGRILGKMLKCKVIYTAHGFHFFKGNNLLKNFLFKNIERYCAHYTDVLITINKEDYEAAKKFKLRENGRLEYVPGVGIDINAINCINGDKAKLCEELNIPNDSVLLLSVGELNSNKNHKIVIESLPELPNNVHYLICGVGLLKKEYEELAQKMNISQRLHLLGYRKDVIKIMKSCDIFVFPSKREGLSVALMEASASQMLCIASKIRGNVDIITNDNLLLDLDTFKEKFINVFNSLLNEKISTPNDCSKFSRKNIQLQMIEIYKSI